MSPRGDTAWSVDSSGEVRRLGGVIIAVSLIGLVAVLALLVAIAAFFRAPGPSLVGRTVVIHTKRPDDRTIRGVLHGQYTDRWTLRDAVVILPGKEQPLGGLEHIPVANISFAQEVEA